MGMSFLARIYVRNRHKAGVENKAADALCKMIYILSVALVLGFELLKNNTILHVQISRLVCWTWGILKIVTA